MNARRDTRPSDRRLRTPALGVAALLLLAALVALPGTAQADCRDVPASTLRVFRVEHETLSVAAVDMSEIDRLAAEHNIAEPLRRPHPLLLVVPELTSALAIDEHAIEASPGVFCAAPASVEARIGITGYRVYIERVAYADACIRTHLIDHARRHLDADNRGVAATIEKLRDALVQPLTTLKETPADSAEAAIANFKAGVAALLLQAVESFGRERPQLHASVDTPAEIADLNAACGGHMRSLESRALKHGPPRHFRGPPRAV